MKIDDRVEQKVRDTLHWVVKQKPDEFDAALLGFSDSATRTAALELLVRICGVVVTNAFGHVPSGAEVEALADQIAEIEQWSSVESKDVASFVGAVLGGTQPSNILPSESVPVVAFVVAGSLLSSQPKEEGEWWFDYLDTVEAAIEAAG